MATITRKGNPTTTLGSMPSKGSEAPDFTLVKPDLSNLSLSSLKGGKVILNIFPSQDTSTCAASMRNFNLLAAGISKTIVPGKVVYAQLVQEISNEPDYDEALASL
jgi:thiol peroxidase